MPLAGLLYAYRRIAWSAQHYEGLCCHRERVPTLHTLSTQAATSVSAASAFPKLILTAAMACCMASAAAAAAAVVWADEGGVRPS